MQIIIDISEDLYSAVRNGLNADEIWDLRVAVTNGTLLPKGHGKLIDTDDIKVIELDDGVHFIQHKKGDDIDVYIDATTVIEADKEEYANGISD